MHTASVLCLAVHEWRFTATRHTDENSPLAVSSLCLWVLCSIQVIFYGVDTNGTHKIWSHDSEPFFLFTIRRACAASCPDVKIGGRIEEADGRRSMSLFSPCQAFKTPHPWPDIYIQGFSRARTHTHRQILLSPSSPFSLLLKCTLPHILSASLTVWILLLFIEEGFALAQKTKGETAVLLLSVNTGTSLNH